MCLSGSISCYTDADTNSVPSADGPRTDTDTHVFLSGAASVYPDAGVNPYVCPFAMSPIIERGADAFFDMVPSPIDARCVKVKQTSCFS